MSTNVVRKISLVACCLFFANPEGRAAEQSSWKHDLTLSILGAAIGSDAGVVARNNAGEMIARNPPAPHPRTARSQHQRTMPFAHS